MYVVVVGLGEVGRHVVRTLEWEKHDVVAIDVNASAIEYIEEHHDVMTLQGYGASERTLVEAGVEKADLVVAVTDNDEVNLIVALAAKQMGAQQVIARVQGDQWSGGPDETPSGVQYGLLGVNVVFNPRVLLAREVANIAQSHGALDVIDLANDRIEVAQVKMVEGNTMLNKPLHSLPIPPQVLIGAIVRNNSLFVPKGMDDLRVGDRVYLIGQPENMIEAEELFTRRTIAKRVAIVGGGVVGFALARLLLETKTEVMVIEANVETAHRLATQLPSATIVVGDGTDLNLLKEERVDGFDLFVACTHEDEVNLMAGLLAKRLGVPRTVTLAHRPDYQDIYLQLGIDIVLSPRIVASEHVLRYCRQTELKSLTVLENGEAEVLEILAQPGSRIANVPLRRLPIPSGALVAAILKGDRVIVPQGDDEVAEGDTVVVLATKKARRGVAALFRQRRV